jgi:hypothetical protein
MTPTVGWSRASATFARRARLCVGARVAYAQERREHVVLQQAHVEARDGVLRRDEALADRERVPLAGCEEAEATRRGRCVGAADARDVELLGQTREQRVE